MKKITGLAATMALGLAFCGFCTGCAAGVKESAEAPSVPAASVSADGGYKVILNPGIHVNGTTPATIEAAAASKVTKADPDTYFVENGWIANYATGEDLPKAETARTNVTFAGWRYALDGVPTVVTKMPDVAKLDGDLYLYAHWTAGTGGGGDVTTGAAVNGKAMEENGTPQAGVTEEYMITAEFTAGTVLQFTLDGTAVTIEELDVASTGLQFSGGSVSVVKGGTFEIYLKKVDGKWQVYGSRTPDQSEIERTGVAKEAGGTFLVGNIAGTDVTWSSTKGFKVTGSSIKIKLTAGDDVKIVKYGATAINESSDNTWYDKLVSSDTSAIANVNQGGGNYKPKKTGYYTFTISGSQVNVSFSETE